MDKPFNSGGHRDVEKNVGGRDGFNAGTSPGAVASDVPGYRIQYNQRVTPSDPREYWLSSMLGLNIEGDDLMVPFLNPYLQKISKDSR
jgi:hypothetical protein